ncbi:MAG: Crp/Fnr family transcriptional regulator [Rubrivivax sp.]|nr:Crp/Fnr family transcriptional regulator [Rubrivivax sp.]
MSQSPLLRAALLGAGVELGDAGLADLWPAFSPQTLARNAPLLRPGEAWSAALLIQTGLVRMHFLRRDGREFNKNFFAEGALICPLTPAMWGAPSLFGISSIEPTTVWRCDAQRLRQTLDRHGAWAPLQRELLMRLLTGKLQREHDLLALDGRQRYQAFCERFPHLATRVPLLHLATYLGMTDVSLSRLRRGLKGGGSAAF